MAGLICPKCGARFRAGFTRCNHDNVDLVDDDTYAALQSAKGGSRAALAGRKTVAILHASLPACREIERAFREAGIHCLVEANSDDEVLAPGVLKVGLHVAEDDLPRAAEVLKQSFEGLIAKEGVGSFNTEAIDLSAETITCPACSHVGALKDGACADCGLFLGAPE